MLLAVWELHSGRVAGFFDVSKYGFGVTEYGS